jgi:hypothetical protein
MAIAPESPVRDGRLWGAMSVNTADDRVSTRMNLDGDSVIARVLRAGQPQRIEDFSPLAGSVAERARQPEMRSAIGCPIIVGSRTWE